MDVLDTVDEVVMVELDVNDETEVEVDDDELVSVVVVTVVVVVVVVSVVVVVVVVVVNVVVDDEVVEDEVVLVDVVDVQASPSIWMTCRGLYPAEPLDLTATGSPSATNWACSGVLYTNGAFSTPAISFTSTPPALCATT